MTDDVIPGVYDFYARECKWCILEQAPFRKLKGQGGGTCTLCGNPENTEPPSAHPFDVPIRLLTAVATDLRVKKPTPTLIEWATGSLDEVVRYFEALKLKS